MNAPPTEPAQDFWLRSLGDATRHNAWVLDIIRPYLGRRVMEIGCGVGNFTALLAEADREVTGLELSEQYAERARARFAGRPNVEVRCGDATLMQWDGAFDSVVMLDVLEHIEDDAGLLRSLRERIHTDGHLVLKVPAGAWLYGEMDRAIGHHRRYTKASLLELLRRTGFAPAHVRYFNMIATAGWWLNGRVLKRDRPPAEQVRLAESLVPVLRLVERVAPPPFGLALIAAAVPA